MHIDLIVVGKTDSTDIHRIIEEYLKRINRYLKCSLVILPDVRNSKGLSQAQQKKLEGETILRQLTDGDLVVLLDEKGTQYRSIEFAAWLQKRMAGGLKRLCFVIGGPYGFSDEVYARANDMLSLSKMTFSHQLIRVLFTEQLYRACTILNNEPYHHE